MPLFHPTTEKLIAASANKLPHSVALVGEHGAGLHTAARELTARMDATVQTISPEKDGKVNYDSGSIGVAAMRELYDTTAASAGKPRIFLLEHAERMTEQAQNAFLKLLEEPASSIHFILLAHDSSALLSTVRSRVQIISVRPITDVQSNQLLDELRITDATIRQQLLFVASGRPALLTYLAQNPAKLEAKATLLRDARSFLSEEPYERLVIASRYGASRPKAVSLIESVALLLKRSLQQADDAQLEPLTHRVDACEQALERLQANSNIRLALLAAAMA